MFNKVMKNTRERNLNGKCDHDSSCVYIVCLLQIKQKIHCVGANAR